jgi:SAM-dependent methyltransferase
MKIKSCRVCKSKKIDTVHSLGSMFFTGIFPKLKNNKVPKGELKLIRCRKCCLLQLEDNFDSKLMYGDNYGYMSSLNKAMESHLQLKSKYLLDTYKLKKSSYILDIGSNDGTFLNFFNKNFKLFACDPTIKKFKNYYRKDIKLISDFFSKDKFKDLKFNLITSIAMFYDLPDPLKFAKDIKSVLSKEGIWHIEMSYMPSMLNNISYDTICHEHLEYYSVKSLKHLMDLANLKIIDISFNQVNGGSISLDIAQMNSKHVENKTLVEWLLLRENLNGSNNLKIQKQFFNKCNKQRLLLNDLLKKLKLQGKKIYGYGASTKGNVILQYCGINEKYLDCIIEVNKFKFNKYTPGSKIKILSEKHMNKKKPDYLLVLPWHFKDYIIKKENLFLRNGGKMIFPLPEIEII